MFGGLRSEWQADIEKAISGYIRHLRGRCITVQAEMIQAKARQQARERGILTSNKLLFFNIGIKVQGLSCNSRRLQIV